MHKGKIFIISGTSGSGKTTLVREVLKDPGLKNFRRVETYTTRPRRAGEKNSQDYHFLSEADFKHKIKAHFFTEYSCEYGNYYGTPASALADLDLGLSLIYILDLKGAIQFKELYSQITRLIWIDVDLVNLEERLKRRNEGFSEIQCRLDLAKKEKKDVEDLGIFDAYIYNEDMQKALLELKAALLKNDKK